MKKVLIATVLAIGLTTAGGYAYAHGNGSGSGYGGHGMMMGGGGYGMMGGGTGMMGGGTGMGMMNDYGDSEGGYNHPGAAGFGRNGWTSEQNQKFLDDTIELRKEMHNKRFEYKEAQRNPKTTRQQLSTMEKEMIDLRDKIYDKAPQNQEAEQNKQQ